VAAPEEAKTNPNPSVLLLHHHQLWPSAASVVLLEVETKNPLQQRRIPLIILM
jgi:hypothetical protein